LGRSQPPSSRAPSAPAPKAPLPAKEKGGSETPLGRSTADWGSAGSRLEGGRGGSRGRGRRRKRRQGDRAKVEEAGELLVQSYTIHYLAKGRTVISAAGEDGPVRP
jgi:hypothetical protein